MNSETTLKNAVSSRSKAANFISTLSQLDRTMKLNELQVILFVAMNQDQEGGLTTNDIKGIFDLSSPTLSRLTYYWADGVSGSPQTGHGLLSVSIDASDRRRRLLRLTPKGEKFFKELECILD